MEARVALCRSVCRGFARGKCSIESIGEWEWWGRRKAFLMGTDARDRMRGEFAII